LEYGKAAVTRYRLFDMSNYPFLLARLKKTRRSRLKIPVCE
jgi:hypothetical protein